MKKRPPRRSARVVALVTSIVAMAVVIWIDVATGLWQQVVILSGIAAGLLTFLLTAFFLEGWVARAEHERWLPVTRVALTDILHTLADDERSEITRGMVVPRRLELDGTATDDGHAALEKVHEERVELTTALERWASFLAASADVQELMIHIAQIALLLDELRDTIVELERTGAPSKSDRVKLLVEQYNGVVASAVDEIHGLLRQDS